MTLPELRAELAEALTAAGLPAVAAGEPARLAPPCAVIGAGSPYLGGAGGPFGHRLVRLRVRLVVQPGETALVDLDDMIEIAVPAIERAGDRDTGWDVPEVSEPITLMVAAASFPAVEITATTTTPDF